MDGCNRLATYGSLAPGRANHHHLAEVRGIWSPGEVRGRLLDGGWGASLGYPGIVLDPDAAVVDVQVLESEALPSQWCRLDAFEGPGYERVLTTVHTDAGDVEAFIYVLS